MTIPHKEEAAALAKERDSYVQTAHAANTLVRAIDGKFSAFNTDYSAAVESLKSFLSTHTREDGTSLQMSHLE